MPKFMHTPKEFDGADGADEHPVPYPFLSSMCSKIAQGPMYIPPGVIDGNSGSRGSK